MTVLTHARNRHRRWLAWLVGLAALILPVSLLTTAAASAAQHSAAPASRCTAAYLTSALHLSHVTVDSAAPDTSGSYTPPGTTTPITGLPDFCDVALTQTDSAGNPCRPVSLTPCRRRSSANSPTNRGCWSSQCDIAFNSRPISCLAKRSNMLAWTVRS